VEVTAPQPVDPTRTRLEPLDPRWPSPAPDGAEALRLLPGAGLARKGGIGGEPVLRGLSGSRLGILADGEETPGGCGGRMDPPSAYLFPGTFDQVEVVKGPQTVCRGVGAWAGSADFRRLPPRWERPGWAAAGAWLTGSFGREERAARVQAGAPGWYGRAGAVRSRSGDYRAGGGGTVHSRYDRWSVDGALGWTPGPRLRLELRGTRSDGQAAYADRTLDGVAYRRDHVGLVLELRDLGAGSGRLEGRVYDNVVDHLMDNATLRPFVPGPGAPGPGARNPRRATRGARCEAEFWTGTADTWILGAEVQDSRHDVRRSPDTWTLPVDRLGRGPDLRLERAGVFGEWARSWGRGDRLVAGLRGDRWRAEDLRRRLALGPGGMANPTAGVRRNLGLAAGFVRREWVLGRREIRAYAGLGHAQRPPDYWELLPLEAVDGPSAFGAPRERATQLDLGAQGRAGSWQLTGSAFCGQVSDFLLVQARHPKGGRAATVIRGIQARLWGGELALARTGPGALRAEGSLAFTRGENRTDHLPLAQVPPPEARLGLAWVRPAGSAGVRVRLVAPRDHWAPGQGTIAGLDLGPSPGFGVVALHGGWSPRRFPFLRVQAGVENLLDRAYAEAISRPASGATGTAGPPIRVPEPGRLAWLRVTLGFP
jgi:iron complex outermembrane receptor protein